jgi:N-acetylmuramoyl-L-alanine amidase
MIFRKCIGLIALILSCAVTMRATDWNIIKQHGRDYVTFANVAEFYRFAGYSRVENTVTLQSERRGLRAETGTSELYINGVRFFTNFPITSQGNDALISAMDVGKIIEPVLRPSRLKDAHRIETVILDPGHGGMDQGTANQWGSEKQFALDVAMSARDQLLRAGFKVEMTRSTDTAVSLEERVEFANRFTNAVFISIHFNSGGGEGVESYWLAPDGVTSNAAGESHASASDSQPNEGNAQDGQNVALAAAVHAAVLAQVPTVDRGVRHARFKVLRDIAVPALLLEAGFLTDPAEGLRIGSLPYRQQLGAAIAQGVQAFDAAVNYRSPNATFPLVKADLPPRAPFQVTPLELETTPPPSDKPSVSISADH